jgi:hypothetical protein
MSPKRVDRRRRTTVRPGPAPATTLVAAPATPAWERPLIVALCVLAALRVFVFAAAFPFFSNVDEHHHVDLTLKYARGDWPNGADDRYDIGMARLAAEYGTLEYVFAPARLAGGMFPRPIWESPRRDERWLAQRIAPWTGIVNHEAHSPPVYYLVAGAWSRIGDWLGLRGGGRLYWLRFLNVPIVGLLVWCGYLFCRDWLPGRLDLRIGVPSLLAFVPQDVFYSVNSDVLSPLLFTLALMAMLAWSRRDTPGPASSAVAGLLVALTFLVKYTNIALPVVFALVVALTMRRLLRAHRTGTALTAGSVALVAAALPVALWFWRNLALLGEFSGNRAKMAALTWSWRPPTAWLDHPIFTPAGLWTFWSGLMKTFWRGEFVWHAQPLASAPVDAFYALSSAVFLAAAGVVAVRPTLLGRAANGLRRCQGLTRLVVWASVVLSVLALALLSTCFDYGRSPYPSTAHPYFTSGRLIAGALVPFAVLYVEGIAVVVSAFSREAAVLICVAAAAALMTASEVMLTAPVFASPYNWFHLP